ncbi:hypothetical protein IWW50_004479 [Coemansia erecta]|nr:hypothetical protein IWW50_004479 [Coemansia erecta]
MSRHEYTATQGTSGLSRGERRMQELLDHLKTVESTREKQGPLLEGINRQQKQLESAQDTVKLSQTLGEDCRRANDLASQEQHAADAALEIVNRLLSKMEAREAESNSNELERQQAKRQKLEPKSSPARGETHQQQQQQQQQGRDRRLSRSGDGERPAIDRRRGSEAQESDRSRRESSTGREARRERDKERERDRDRARDKDRDRDRSRGRERDRSRDHARRSERDSGHAERSSRRDADDTRGSMRIISKGSLVAVRVAAPGAEGGEEWILATVLSYSSEKNRYTVQDYDVESAVRPTYVLSPRLVLFVTSDPTLASSKKKPLWDRSRNPEVPRGQRVLALYPRTTAFYQCTVVTPPSQNTSVSGMLFPPAPGVPMGPADPSLGAMPDPTANPMYKVQFDDDNGNLVDVPAHLVIPMPRSSH